MDTVFVLTSSWVNKLDGNYKDTYDIVNGVYVNKEEVYAEKSELEKKMNFDLDGFLGAEIHEVYFHDPQYEYYEYD